MSTNITVDQLLNLIQLHHSSIKKPPRRELVWKEISLKTKITHKKASNISDQVYANGHKF